MASSTPKGTRNVTRVRSHWRRRVLAGSAALALAVTGTGAAASASTHERATSQLQSVTASPYTGVLANAKGDSLYVLSTESKGSLHCTSKACRSTWPPFLVKSTTKSISKSGAVKGKVGFVKRSSTMKQVTYNGFPVYRYAGDGGPRQDNGEGVAADGGTWTLASAPSKTTAGTPIPPQGGSGGY